MRTQLWLYRIAFGGRPWFVVAATPAEAIDAALVLENKHRVEHREAPMALTNLREFKVDSIVDGVAP